MGYTESNRILILNENKCEKGDCGLFKDNVTVFSLEKKTKKQKEAWKEKSRLTASLTFRI